MTITIYSKPNCQQCTATKRAFDRKGVAYHEVDITLDEEAYDLVESLGFKQAPVVVTDRGSWAGFRPDMIDAAAETEGKGAQ